MSVSSAPGSPRRTRKNLLAIACVLATLTPVLVVTADAQAAPVAFR